MSFSKDVLIHTTKLLVMLVVVISSQPGRLAGQTWVEDSFQDFADGRLDAAGQNIYVGRDGSVRTIHRFDLNQDGHLELVFNSTHDRYTSIPATVATYSSKGRISFAPLAVDGCRQVALADLNNDGYLDAAFCPNDSGVQHGRRFVTIIWGGADGWPAHRAGGRLPVHRARRIAVADLNADGWRDIVVLNGTAWLPGQPSGQIVRIFWGSQSGFVLHKRSDVGIPGAIDIDSGDLDANGADDLAVLTSKGECQVLWAAKSKPSLDSLSQTSVALHAVNATCLTVGDINNDGHLDLVSGSTKQTVSMVSAAAGKTWGKVHRVRATNASQIAVGDLDGDRHADMVLTDFRTARAAGGEASGAQSSTAFVHVLWGDETGFSAKTATQIPIRHAAATAIGDLNADGIPDLAVAVHQGTQTMTTDSVVFLGTGNRRFKRSRDELRTTGASHVAIAPARKQLRDSRKVKGGAAAPNPDGDRNEPRAAADRDLPARAVFCNSVGGTLREEVPIQVYWGSKTGFDAAHVWNIPFASGYESTAADLNRDGFTDFIALNSGHSGEVGKRNPHLGVNIFWGSAEGFDVQKRRTVLREFNLGTSNVADLNRDGYLDLVLGQFAAAKPATTAELIIYYGGAQGFERERRVAIASPGRSISTVIADFNRDHWLDVAVNSYDKNRVRIFWGGTNGFDSDGQLQLPIHRPIDVETADLNRDGHLDLIVGTYHDQLANVHDTGTTIFWGSRNGFQFFNAQWLPGFTPIGHCVADFDGDGHLDLFTPHYHANGTRESIPSYLFWGSSRGFAADRRTSLICDSAHDALAADFNRDGRLDLAVVCHALDGKHHTVSKVFYNDGQRFHKPKVATLPTHGPHWMWQEDMGHIANRKWQQTYESSVFKWDQPATGGKLKFKAKMPPGTGLKFAIRSAPKRPELERQAWREVCLGRFKLKPRDRLLQYRVKFKSDNGDRYPRLDRIEIELE